MENWKQWILEKDMPLPDDIRSVLIDDEGLVISCIDKTKMKRIIFKFLGSIYTYRFTDEGCFLKTLYYLSKQYGESFIQSTSLFKVEDSNYLQWFKEESCDAWGVENFEHYVIYTQNDVLEILSPYPPEIVVETVM